MNSTSRVFQMLQRLLLVLALLLATSASAIAQGRARLSSDLEESLRVNDAQIDVIVQGNRAEVDAVARQHAVRVKRYLKRGAVLDVNAGQLDALRQDASIHHLSGDAPVRASVDPARETVGADQVWAGLGSFPRPLNGRNVVVAVIDSGVDATHQALRGRVLASVDFTGGNGRDGYGHGTHVASLIAGAAGGAADTANYSGVAPGARLVSLRVLDDNGVGRASSVIDAIDWAIDNRQRYGIQVINLSLGGPVTQSYVDDPLCEAAERAVAAGITVVASAGNFGQTPEGAQIFGGITSPGIDPLVITVGALDTRGTAARSDDRIAKFSSRGPTAYDQLIKPDLVAPGRNLVAAEATGSTIAAQSPERHVTGSGATGYIQLSGSSMSAGVVSGAVALLLDRRPGLIPAQIRTVLQVTSSYMPSEGLVATGAGSLNALAAVNFLDRQSPAGTPTVIAGETVLAGGLAIDAKRSPAGQFANTSGSGTVMGSKIIWGTSADADKIIWGSAAELDKVIWGTSSNDTIIWGNSANDTIIWGQSSDSDKIIWGTGSLDKIIWGTAASGKIIWGTRGNDTIVWGSRSSDTIVWGGHTSTTMVWGSDSSDTIVWGSHTRDKIIWGTGSNDTIVWGGGSSDTIVWGSGADDTIIWGSSLGDTTVWGSAVGDTIIWG